MFYVHLGFCNFLNPSVIQRLEAGYEVLILRPETVNKTWQETTGTSQRFWRMFQDETEE
jgi:hypothetical protein